MKVILEIPDFDGNGIDVIWEGNGRLKIRVVDRSVEIRADSKALMSLAKQMIYFANHSLYDGCHVHLDSFFCGKGFEGDYGLILSKMED